MYKSTDFGENWIRIGTASPSIHNVRDIVINPKTPSTIYAGSVNGIFKSEDDGESWIAINQGLISDKILALQLILT